MKVLFVVRRLDRGGAEGQLVLLARTMAAHDHDVVVASFRPGSRDGAFSGTRVRHVHLGVAGRGSIPRAIGRLVSLARSFRPDVIHGYLDAPNVLAGLIAPLARPAVAVWGVRALAYDVQRLPRISRVLHRLESPMSRTASLVIVNSDAARGTAVARGYDARKIVVVDNAIDTDVFRRDLRSRTEMRSRVNLSADALVVARVGRIDVDKNWEGFLEAIHIVRQRCPNVRALCVGDGNDRYADELRAYACSLRLGECVMWLGGTDDMAAVYNASDLVVSTSHRESMPNVLLEAMACEVPVVVTNVGDSARVLGDTGTIVEPNSALKFADAIESVLTSPRDTRAAQGARARERVQQLFSPERLYERTMLALECATADGS